MNGSCIMKLIVYQLSCMQENPFLSPVFTGRLGLFSTGAILLVGYRCANYPLYSLLPFLSRYASQILLYIVVEMKGLPIISPSDTFLEIL